ncbi:hypothetical protein HYDPIDRAFT_23676 [Hydnomerulius pinastri MD-312]|nr:hypothetical protein HYDPIDRAFT_23676 [Hydnomerulius pinastri MD-312]
MSTELKFYRHGRFKVAGGIIPDAVTAYQTYGNSQNPCIVFPTCFGAKLAPGSQDYLIGEGKILDPTKYFIVIFALFGNGESSSPSNTPVPFNGPYFPFVSYEDNIRAHHAVLTQALGVTKVFCVVGFSMGGQQAYYWPVVFPDFVQRFVAICVSARTSPHNQWFFIEGPKIALPASKGYADGHYTSPPQHGIRAFGGVYCAWAYGQAWFREHKIPHGWVKLSSERTGKVRDGGDYEAALGSIQAKGLIMPSKTDLYFPPEVSEIEVSHLRNAQLEVIPTVWGHMAGIGLNPVDLRFISEGIRDFLSSA